MIQVKCAEDCGADIVVLEANRPIVCWNCGRSWTEGKRSFIEGQPTKIFTQLPEARPVADDPKEPIKEGTDVQVHHT